MGILLGAMGLVLSKVKGDVQKNYAGIFGLDSNYWVQRLFKVDSTIPLPSS